MGDTHIAAGTTKSTVWQQYATIKSLSSTSCLRFSICSSFSTIISWQATRGFARSEKLPDLCLNTCSFIMFFLDFPCVWFKNEQIVEEFLPLPLSPFFPVFPLNLPVKNWDISRKSVGCRFFQLLLSLQLLFQPWWEIWGNVGKIWHPSSRYPGKKTYWKNNRGKKRVERSSPCFHFAFLTPRARPEASGVNIDAVRAKVVYWNPMWPYMCRCISFRVIQTQWWFHVVSKNGDTPKSSKSLDDELVEGSLEVKLPTI